VKFSITDVITDPRLLGPYFSGRSWDTWRCVLKASYGHNLSPRELTTFRQIAGERAPPQRPVREVVMVVGRGGGKDVAASTIAVHAALNLDPAILRPGEKGTVLVLANSKDQAMICRDYVLGYFQQQPLLAGMVAGRTPDGGLLLKNRAEIVVLANSLRAPRGRRIIAAVYDELGTWRDENGANPDAEVDAAVTPGLARHSGAMKVMISSPYRRAGLLYNRWLTAFGKDDPDTLVVHGASRTFNPTLDQSIIDAELAKDRPRASAEYLAEWRDDISSFVSADLVAELIDHGVHERPPQPRTRYVAFADESSGQGGDASSLAICHAEPDGRVTQDALRVYRPPFSPTQVIADKCELLRRYRIAKVTGDGWAPGLVEDAYRAHGIRYIRTADSKSDIYMALMGLLSSRRVVMLDHDQQRAELLGLERRAGFGGNERIDHPAIANAHDDAINALAGAAVIAAEDARVAWMGKTGEAAARAKLGPAAFIPQHPPANANSPDNPPRDSRYRAAISRAIGGGGGSRVDWSIAGQRMRGAK
jgi:hypothetical protein